MNELIPNSNEVGTVIHDMMMPILEPLCVMLKQNTEALERISSTLNIQGKQIEALEKQVRMNTPVTGVQARYINTAIRERSSMLLDKYGINDKVSIDALSRKIRKDILVRIGVGSVREFPRCEYDVAIRTIDTWMNAIAIREIVKGAKHDRHDDE